MDDDTTQPASDAAPAEAPKPADAGALVDTWFNECIQGSDVARNTALYNVVLAAVGELKSRLAAAKE